MPKITGNKYFSHQAKFIETGDLKALKLMMRHYEARVEQNLPVAGALDKQRFDCIHPLARAVGTINEFQQTESVVTLRYCTGECIVYICDECVCFFARHSILTHCLEPDLNNAGVGFDMPLEAKQERVTTYYMTRIRTGSSGSGYWFA